MEVETAEGRVGYGPVTSEDVADLFDNDFLNGDKHAKSLGNVEELDWFKNQERLTFARCGIIESTNVAEYESLGGFVGLKNALATDQDGIIQEVLDSGLRGRGGAAFLPASSGAPLQTAKLTRNISSVTQTKAIRGLFSDRLIMEGDPLSLVEGMTIAGLRRRRH